MKKEHKLIIFKGCLRWHMEGYGFMSMMMMGSMPYVYPHWIYLANLQNQPVKPAAEEILPQPDPCRAQPETTEKTALKVSRPAAGNPIRKRGTPISNIPHVDHFQSKSDVSKQQNPERNVLTNISSQLFTFLLSRRKCYRLMKQIKPDLTEEWEESFYRFVKEIRSKFSGYYNLSKMQKMWFGESQEQFRSEHRHMLRIMSRHYIRYRLVCALLTSKKLSKQLRNAHLKTRRDLLRLLGAHSE